MQKGLVCGWAAQGAERVEQHQQHAHSQWHIPTLASVLQERLIGIDGLLPAAWDA